MWRVDIDPSLDDGSDDGTVGGYKIVAGRLAAVSFLKSVADVSTVNPAAKNRRKFFYPPDVVSVRAGANATAIGNYDLVTAVVGNRADPLNLNVQNRYYAFADTNLVRMPDENSDGRADYCRATGSSSGSGSRLRCTLSRGNLLLGDSVINIADWGYSDRRWIADSDGDGRAEYCRAIGSSWGSNSFLSCTQ